MKKIISIILVSIFIYLLIIPTFAEGEVSSEDVTSFVDNAISESILDSHEDDPVVDNDENGSSEEVTTVPVYVETNEVDNVGVGNTSGSFSRNASSISYFLNYYNGSSFVEGANDITWGLIGNYVGNDLSDSIKALGDESLHDTVNNYVVNICSKSFKHSMSPQYFTSIYNSMSFVPGRSYNLCFTTSIASVQSGGDYSYCCEYLDDFSISFASFTPENLISSCYVDNYHVNYVVSFDVPPSDSGTSYVSNVVLSVDTSKLIFRGYSLYYYSICDIHWVKYDTLTMVIRNIRGNLTSFMSSVNENFGMIRDHIDNRVSSVYDKLNQFAGAAYNYFDTFGNASYNFYDSLLLQQSRIYDKLNENTLSSNNFYDQFVGVAGFIQQTYIGLNTIIENTHNALVNANAFYAFMSGDDNSFSQSIHSDLSSISNNVSTGSNAGLTAINDRLYEFMQVTMDSLEHFDNGYATPYLSEIRDDLRSLGGISDNMDKLLDGYTVDVTDYVNLNDAALVYPIYPFKKIDLGSDLPAGSYTFKYTISYDKGGYTGSDYDNFNNVIYFFDSEDTPVYSISNVAMQKSYVNTVQIHKTFRYICFCLPAATSARNLRTDMTDIIDGGLQSFMVGYGSGGSNDLSDVYYARNAAFTNISFFSGFNPIMKTYLGLLVGIDNINSTLLDIKSYTGGILYNSWISNNTLQSIYNNTTDILDKVDDGFNTYNQFYNFAIGDIDMNFDMDIFDDSIDGFDDFDDIDENEDYAAVAETTGG